MKQASRDGSSYGKVLVWRLPLSGDIEHAMRHSARQAGGTPAVSAVPTGQKSLKPATDIDDARVPLMHSLRIMEKKCPNLRMLVAVAPP